MHQILTKFIHDCRIDLRTTIFDLHIEENEKSITVGGLIHDKCIKGRLISYLENSTSLLIVDKIEQALESKVNIVGLIRVSVANLHKEPSFTSSVVTQALMGTIVKVLQSRGDWLYVQLPDGYLGWISEMVSILTDNKYEEWINSPKLIVTERQDLCYTSIDESYIVSDIVAGNILSLKDEAGPYYQVIYPDGRTGYVKKRSVQMLYHWFLTRTATEDSIVETARSFTGIPYLWGGFSPKAVDCSGFVKLVYFLNGIILPRDADMQAKAGCEIDINSDFTNIKPGDLLFFGRKGPGDSQIPITHVGLSLGVKRYMQSSGDVHVSSFDPDDPEFDERRSESLVKVKRILGSDNITKLDMIAGYKELVKHYRHRRKLP